MNKDNLFNILGLEQVRGTKYDIGKSSKKFINVTKW